MESSDDAGRARKRKVVQLPLPPHEKRQKPGHEQVDVEKVRLFHASQKSSGGIQEESSRRAVETIHEEEVIQKEYVFDSTTVGGEESATKLGATEIPPEEGLTSDGEKEEVEEEEEHEGLSDGAVQELSPESPRPQPGVNFNSSAMSTVRMEFSKQYEFPEIEEMRLAVEAEAKMRSGASTSGVGGHPLHGAWSFEALQAAVTVADTVLVAAIRNVSESGQRTPAEAVPRSELEYAAQVLTDDVMKFALRRVMTADEVEKTRLRQHAVWPARAVRAATILTDDILNTAIRRWNDEQAWRDEILERSWSQKAISIANLVTKHVLEAALHRVKSATNAVPALQSSRRHDPVWSEDALRAAILLTDDILSSAVLHINAGDGTGVRLNVQLPLEHPWTLDAIRAASKIVHSVLAEALEESFDAANSPLLAVSSTDEILAAALHQLQQQGAVDPANVDHRLHGVSTLASVHVPPAPRNTVEDEHHSQAFMPTYKPEDDILGFRRHIEETCVKTGSAHTSVSSVATTIRSLSAEHSPEAVARQLSGSASSGKVHPPESADHQRSASSSTHSLTTSKGAGSSHGPSDQMPSHNDIGPADAKHANDDNVSVEAAIGVSQRSQSQRFVEIPTCPFGAKCKVKTRLHKQNFAHASPLPSMGDVPAAPTESTSSVLAEQLLTGMQIPAFSADPEVKLVGKSTELPRCKSGADCRLTTQSHVGRFRHPAPDSELVPSSPADRLSSAKILSHSKQNESLTSTSTASLGSCPMSSLPTTLEVRENRTKVIQAVLSACGAPPDKFSAEELQESAAFITYEIPTAELKHRIDLRSALVFTIDGPNCIIKDDALHWRQLDDGRHEVGIHITDVSHFVRPGTKLDSACRARGEALYLRDQRIDCLPTAFCTDVLSLLPEKDSLCTSLILLLSPEYKVVSARLEPTIIRSQVALSNAQANRLMAIEQPTGQSLCDNLITALRHLQLIKTMLQNHSEANGTLLSKIPDNKLIFSIDTEDGDDDEIIVVAVEDREFDSGLLVAFYMECYNVEVSRYLFKQWPMSTLLRGQDRPSEEQLRPLTIASQAHEFYKFQIDTATFHDLQQSVVTAVVPKESAYNKMLRLVAMRCLHGNAAYVYCSGRKPSSQHYHYTSGCSQYMQCSSPARRYCDLFAQQQLATVKGWIPLNQNLVDAEYIQKLAAELNVTSLRTARIVKQLKSSVKPERQRPPPTALDTFINKLKATDIIKSTKNKSKCAKVPPELRCMNEFSNILTVSKEKLEVFIERYGRTYDLKFHDSKRLFSFDPMNCTVTAGDEVFDFYRLVLVHLVVDIARERKETGAIHLVKPFVPGFSLEACDGSQWNKSSGDCSVASRAVTGLSDAGAAIRSRDATMDRARDATMDRARDATMNRASDATMDRARDATMDRASDAASGSSTQTPSRVKKPNKIPLVCVTCQQNFQSTLEIAQCVYCGKVACSAHIRPGSRHGCSAADQSLPKRRGQGRGKSHF